MLKGQWGMIESRQGAERFKRPMLRPSVTYFNHGDSVDFHFGDRGFVLRGKASYALVHRLVSLLDGKVALLDIQSALPAKVTPIFELIFENLVKHDLVIEGPRDWLNKQGLAPPIRSYLQDFSADWERAAVSWQQCAVTISAPDKILASLVRSLNYAGARDIRVLRNDDCALRYDDPMLVEVTQSINHQTPAELLASPPGPDSLLLFVHRYNDGVNPELDNIDHAHGATIPLIIFDNGALVGPSQRGQLGQWLDLCTTFEIAGDPLTAAVTSAAAAQLAFDAIHCVARDPANGLWLHRDVKLVRADGTAEPLPLDVLLARRRIDMASPADRAVPALRDERDPWRNSESGPFKLVQPPGPAYPLPHCAYELEAGPSGKPPSSSIVCNWGVSMAAAEQRAMLRACEKLVLLARPALDPLFVAAAIDEVSARQLVRARMIARSVDPCTIKWQRGERDQLNADNQMLCRLAHLYWDRWPEFEVAEVADGCWLSRAQLGEWTSFAIEVGRTAAITEAIGDALSYCQTGQRSPLQSLIESAVDSMVEAGNTIAESRIRLYNGAGPPGIFTAYLETEIR
jgi:hypothetical protein